MNISEIAMHDLIRAFTRNTKEDMNHNSTENHFVTQNGKDLYSWNYVFGDIVDAANNNGLKYKVINRNIWSFVVVASQDMKQLLVFMKEQNLLRILSKYGNNPFHYLPCLLIKNNQLNGQEENHQTSLFEDPEIDEKRMIEAKKMLQEFFESVETIYVCSKEEIAGNVVSVTMNLFNSFGEIIEQKDMTKYMSLDYESSSAINNDNGKQETIPVLKKNLKEGKPIANLNKKQDIKQNTDE